MRIKLSAFIFCLAALALTACKKTIREYVELNKVPVVNAGPYQNITLPGDSVNLSGSASDSDGTVVAYLWSQVSGPVPAKIHTAGAASTYISQTINGDYVFQLMATDNEGATGVDTVAIKINRPTEKTFIAQPSANPGEYLVGIRSGSAPGDISGPGALDFTLAAWTINGDPIIVRELLKFDLSSIPANATIKSANLYLWSYPPPTLNGNFQDANFGSNNAFTIQRVTTNWTPATTNWTNQPATTTANQVVVPHTAQTMLDLNLDVKAMVSSMLGANNHGFMMKLNNENYYTSRLFVGSRSANMQAKYPKLVVVYE